VSLVRFQKAAETVLVNIKSVKGLKVQINTEQQCSTIGEVTRQLVMEGRLNNF
jgi:hypothetical protein